ncbi:MAG: hypothetical protein SF069_11640, partial [Phycisphaerae bacterium]|nr:hypothetical protein [Phycisphaerae bacterium]
VDDAGAVRVQYQYDPYGELVIRDVPLPGSLPLPGPTAKSPLFSVGFQGLFFERFYGLLVESAGGGQRSNVTDPPLYVPAPVSAAGGNGGAGGVGSASGSTQVREFYYVRNRCNCPRDARFTTRDPNDAGFPIISRLSSNGDVVWYGAGPFSADGHYGDGMNLYGFLGGNPANLRDPLGLDILDDEGISADVQSWGLATSQLSVAAGTAFSFADVGTLIASGFLSLTSGSGRTWVDNMSDCVKRLGPVHSNNTIVWSVATAAKLAVTSFTPVPKWALVYGKDSDGAASTGPWGLPSSRIA